MREGFAADIMASENDEIDALVRSDIYKSREETIADAMRALLSMGRASAFDPP